jgi:hypothetical protein
MTIIHAEQRFKQAQQRRANLEVVEGFKRRDTPAEYETTGNLRTDLTNSVNLMTGPHTDGDAA